MRILLSTVPITKEATYAGVYFAAAHYPPLGLAYIAAVLEKNGHMVKIIDCTTEGIFSYQAYKDKIGEFNPDIIGLSVYTPTYNSAVMAMDCLKKDFPSTKIVFGGPHATICAEQIMKENPTLDYVITMEGEYTLLELAQNKNPKDILGLVWRDGDVVIKNQPRPIIANLDTLPHPARHLLSPLKKYKDSASRSTRGNVLLIMSSRGCPSNCAFCCQTVGKIWRGHSVDYIFEEIDSIKEPIAKVDFLDDNFTLNRKRLEQFCIKKIKRGDKFIWNCLMRLDGIDDKIIRLMSDAGCNCIFVGIESGSDETLKKINKRITTSFIREKINIIKRHKIDAHGSVIIGYPGETKTSLKITLDFLFSLPLDGTTINLFTPFPGTALSETAHMYGKVSPILETYSTHSPNPPFIPNGFTAEELISFQRTGYRRFYMRPRFILKHMNRIFDIHFLKSAFIALSYFMKKEVQQ